MNKVTPTPGATPHDANAVVLYQTSDGAMSLEVNVRRDTVWLSLNQLAGLFDRDKSVISRHIRNIFTEGELEQDAAITKFSVLRQEGARQIERVTQFYSLDVIVSVGYRVKSERGRQFRQWATNVLRSHTLEGYTVNPRRLATLQEPSALPAPEADAQPSIVAQRRAALEADPARAIAQLACDMMKSWPSRADAEPWVAAVIQLAAHLRGEPLAQDDEAILALARMLTQAEEQGARDAVDAVAAALNPPSDA